MAKAQSTLAIIILAMFAESMSSTLILPFIYFMVKDLGVQDTRDIGKQAGIITSSFWAAQFFSTTVWGIISDRNGRKKVVLAGLAGNALFLPLFGSSRTILWALAARSLCGLLNGNIGVLRTSLGELVEQSDITHSRAFSLLGMGHALGALVGPMVGGFLVGNRGEPAANSSQHTIISPYLWPCLAAGAMNATILVAGIFMFQETNQAVCDKAARDVQEPLLARSPVRKEGGLRQRLGPIRAPLLCLSAGGILALHAIAFDETFPIFASTEEPSSVGLGLKPNQIAVLLSAMGAVVLTTLLFGYPWINRRISALNLCRTTAIVLAVVYPLFPALPTMDMAPKASILITAMVLRYSANAICFTSLNILMNCSVDANIRGLWNGIAQAVVSLLRTVGPACAGYLWSWGLKSGMKFPFNQFIVYLLISVVAVFQFALSLFIPAPPVRV